MNFYSIKEFSAPYRFATGEFQIPNFTDLEALYSSIRNYKQEYRDNQNFQKIEIKSPLNLPQGKPIFEFVTSEETVNLANGFLGRSDLILDRRFDGGGLTATFTDGFLRYHHDFPFSSIVNKYRVLNLIMYFSTPDIDGGDLHLLDPVSQTVEYSFSPHAFKFIMFPTSKWTPHGFSRIRNGCRISFNAYFYADLPLDDRFVATKTNWLS
jgi:hypothetical protein